MKTGFQAASTIMLAVLALLASTIMLAVLALLSKRREQPFKVGAYIVLLSAR